LETTRRGSPRVNAFVQLLGKRYWEFTVNRGLGGVPARYDLPDKLAVTRVAS
jgi:hypothetical protein